MTDEEYLGRAHYAIEAAWYVGTDDWLPRSTLRVLVEQGWTPETVERVVALGTYALGRGTGLARSVAATTVPLKKRQQACARLRGEAQRLVELGLPLAGALDWLAGLAAAPTEQMLDAAGVLRGERAFAGNVALAGWFAAWTTAAGALAPLAWAAGLSVEEAQARRAVGTLTEDGLRMLAGLRGWQFPAGVEVPGAVESEEAGALGTWLR